MRQIIKSLQGAGAPARLLGLAVLALLTSGAGHAEANGVRSAAPAAPLVAEAASAAETHQSVIRIADIGVPVKGTCASASASRCSSSSRATCATSWCRTRRRSTPWC